MSDGQMICIKDLFQPETLGIDRYGEAWSVARRQIASHVFAFS